MIMPLVVLAHLAVYRLVLMMRAAPLLAYVYDGLPVARAHRRLQRTATEHLEISLCFLEVLYLLHLLYNISLSYA